MEEAIVIGAGPAGLSAAIEAAKYGVKITVIDENSRPGGQLFKQIHRFFGSSAHFAGTRGYEIGNYLLSESKSLGVRVLLNTAVWGIFSENRLGIKTEEKTEIIQAKKIIIATGASENPVCFPGWTLPGVMGAGAVQTMMNLHRVLPGKKILMVGSGNVGLIVSYQLLQAGADVIAVVELLPEIGGYLVHAMKIARAGVNIFTSHTIIKAEGRNGVQKVIVGKVDEKFQIIKGSEKEYKVDLICIAAGLTPLIELCMMAGCELSYLPSIGGFVPLHNEDMETTVPGVYIAGDVSGIEEASTAIEEGRLTGVAVAESLGFISKKMAKERKIEIWSNLAELRSGPFGEEKRIAKECLLREFKTKYGR